MASSTGFSGRTQSLLAPTAPLSDVDFGLIPASPPPAELRDGIPGHERLPSLRGG